MAKRYVRELHDNGRKPPTEEEAVAINNEFKRNMALRRWAGPWETPPTTEEPFNSTWMPSPVPGRPGIRRAEEERRRAPLENYWLEEAVKNYTGEEVVKKKGWRFMLG